MTTKRYIIASFGALVLVTGLTVSGTGFAQVYSTPSCSTNTPTVSTNQSAVFTAYGGNGSYVWSGDNLNVNNPTSSQFQVTYPNPGVYTIRVMSNGQTGSCSLNVVGYATTNYYNNNSGSLSCYPSSQTVYVGSPANFSASGGNGSYSWSGPGLTLNNPYGSGFSVTYTTPGIQTVTVMSGGQTASCSVNVLGTTIVPTVIPGLPNTGGGYGKW